jgi:hypothetical protein
MGLSRGHSAVDRASREELDPERERELRRSSDLAAEVVQQIETRMINMGIKLSGLLAKGDKRAIKFAGLGFQSIKHSNTWLETELCGNTRQG